MNVSQIIRIATFALMLIGLVMLVNVFINGETAVGAFIQLGYWLSVIAALAAIVFSVLNLFKDTAKAKNSLIGIGALLVVMAIAYGISSGADFAQYKGDITVTEATSRMVSTGLNAFYIFLFIAIITILYTEVSKAFK